MAAAATPFALAGCAQPKPKPDHNELSFEFVALHVKPPYVVDVKQVN